MLFLENYFNKFIWYLNNQILNFLHIINIKGCSLGTNPMHALAIAQAAKVDRKLYIGNLPTGITPSTVN